MGFYLNLVRVVSRTHSHQVSHNSTMNNLNHLDGGLIIIKCIFKESVGPVLHGLKLFSQNLREGEEGSFKPCKTGPTQ